MRMILKDRCAISIVIASLSALAGWDARRTSHQALKGIAGRRSLWIIQVNGDDCFSPKFYCDSLSTKTPGFSGFTWSGACQPFPEAFSTSIRAAFQPAWAVSKNTRTETETHFPLRGLQCFWNGFVLHQEESQQALQKLVEKFDSSLAKSMPSVPEPLKWTLERISTWPCLDMDLSPDIWRASAFPMVLVATRIHSYAWARRSKEGKRRTNQLYLTHADCAS